VRAGFEKVHADLKRLGISQSTIRTRRPGIRFARRSH
jgi:hypothetical protein